MRSSGDAEGASRREAASGGGQRRLLQQWGLQSEPAGRVRPQVPRARRGAVVGEALVLTARELRLVLTLLLVMFMTGEVWRYVGTLAGPRLLVVIGGPVLAAFVLIGVGLGRQLRPAETVRVRGAAEGEPARAVVAPRVAHRRLVARARGRLWLETCRRPRSVTRPCWSCSPRCGTGRPTCRGAQAEALAAALAGALRGGRAPDARNLSASQGNDRRRVVARWPQPRLGPSSWVAVAAYEPVILTNQGLALAAVGLIAATSFQLPRGGPRLRRRGCR
jgi:hypothetical protein